MCLSLSWIGKPTYTLWSLNMATQNEPFADDISMATLDHHRAYLGSTRLIRACGMC